MDSTRFRASLAQPAPPAGASALLVALWHDGRGDWDSAHRITQSTEGVYACAVHAYLHRKEGDLANADYWYARAGRSRPDCTLDAEWQTLDEGMSD